ncbi:MAG TPA: RNA polymerase sigma factor [Steroidobacteraceae bacterium]|jgi:RNA polymerase sigma-70 factor (ECF subfamily)|nr:RNA polymerase sigma factor [Steroidobacteraceae bacterium]
MFDTLAQSASLPASYVAVVVCGEEQTLDQIQTLNKFLASVEKRAFQIARVSVRDADEALDIVQDAMIKLARRYADRPEEEWRPLFYRILNNRIRDWQRRRMVRNKLFGWLPGNFTDNEESGDPYEAVPETGHGPSEQLMLKSAMVTLQTALHELPARQQQAFCLRNFEGLDVAQTATAMGCSEGSVKTHYSRAVHTLREKLGDAW